MLIETMDVLNIPGPHLQHLLRKRPNGKQVGDDDMIRRALSRDREDRDAVLTFLDTHLQAGTRERLVLEWPDYATKSVLLWRHPFLAPRGDGPDPLVEQLAPAIRRQVNRGRAFEHAVDTFTEKNDAALTCLRVSGEALDATVAIAESITRPSGTLVWPTSVSIKIDLSSDRRISEVYASPTSARRAISVLLAEAFEVTSLPKRRGTERDKYLLPVVFAESDIQALSLAIPMKECGTMGPDPRGLLGDVSVYSKLAGVIPTELDPDDAMVKLQSGPNKKQRQYFFSFAHSADGYRETPVVRFHLNAQHPYFTCQRRTSRPAMRFLTERLHDQVFGP